MSIVKMKRLRLLALQVDRDSILHLLQKQGCVEISDPVANAEQLSLGKPDSWALSAARERSALLSNALLTLNQYSNENEGLFRKRPTLRESELFSEDAYAAGLDIARSILDLERRIVSIAAEQDKLQSQKAALAPWAALNAPLDAPISRSVSLVFGTLPAKVDHTAVTAALIARCDTCELFRAGTDPEFHYVLLLCHADSEYACIEAMLPFGFSRVNVRGWTGTAAENDRRLAQQLAELEEQLAATKKQIASFSSQRGLLRLCADRFAQDVAREEAAARLLSTEHVFLLQGWVPAKSEQALLRILSRFPCAWETETPAPEDHDEVPVKLKNNPLTAPYSVVTELYSLPAYNGLDPNPFLMPFFPLFFGIMFADMAYGLIMVLVGIAGAKLLSHSQTIKSAMGLLIQCGVSTFLLGFFTGSFFGNAVGVIGRIFGRDWSIVPHLSTIRIGSGIAIDLPLNLLEGNNPLYVLILAMILGVVHLAFGVGIGVYLNIRAGNWLDAIAELSWWVIFAGIAVMILAGNSVLLIIGIAIMVTSAFLQGKGFGRVTRIFGAVYSGVTGYLGDVLSYSRLMALMLAGSVIASVFNQLGALGGIVLFIPVAIIGHSLNFALNLIGCFVHTMRLQFLEFFGKWYREGGRPFQPLRYHTKYVNIEEDQP